MTTSLPFHITIARQIGSGGAELGRRVARRLGYAYLDRQILQHAAEELDISEDLLVHREERLQGFWQSMIESFAAGCPEVMLASPPPRIISDESLIEAEKTALQRLVTRGPCVIIGRCGSHALNGRARLLNVFVHASTAFRVERMIRHYGAENEEAARKMIETTDRDRERYVERMTGGSWYDARNYHLSIDLSETGFDMAQQMIVMLVDRMCG